MMIRNRTESHLVFPVTGTGTSKLRKTVIEEHNEHPIAVERNVEVEYPATVEEIVVPPSTSSKDIGEASITKEQLKELEERDDFEEMKGVAFDVVKA